MGKNIIYFYFLEGESEEKVFDFLKQNYIESGKKIVMNLTQKKIRQSHLMRLDKKTHVIIVFDTDKEDGIEILENNISILRKHVEKVILIPQVKNFEDELKRATSIKEIKEFTSSKSNKDFKRDFIKLSNCEKKFKEYKFDINKFWAQNPTGRYVDFINEAHIIKKYK